MLRDRNHPSVVIWCIGNEEGIQGSDERARSRGQHAAAGASARPARGYARRR